MSRSVYVAIGQARSSMKGLTGLVLHNARRSPIRGTMTIVAVAISLVAFSLIRTVSAGWTEQVRQTPDNRVVTRNEMGWLGTLPVHYVQRIREHAGVRRAVGLSWAGLQFPFDRLVEFESVAVEAVPFVEMHYELKAPAEQKQAFIENRQGAFVSIEMANEFGWKPGDTVHFESASFPNDVVLTVSGVFESARRGFARRAVYFHWEYLNELLPEAERDRVNIVAAEVENPRQAARIAKDIDIAFDQGDGRTFSQEDQAVNAQLVGEFSAILSALDFVSVLILGIIMLVLGNTLAMTVRERRKEYGTLRALGFLRKHVMTFVVGEAAVLGLVGGVLGLLLSYPLVTRAASRYLEESMRLAPLHISADSALLTVVMGGMLGALSGLVPAYQLTRTHIVDSLRGVG
jgi:putative ABC transport system permease protein